MSPPASLVPGCFGFTTVTTASKGAIESGHTMPSLSWQRSTTAAIARSTPMPYEPITIGRDAPDSSSTIAPNASL